MRVVPPITVPHSRAFRQRNATKKLRAPSRLPTLVPTQSSWFQRILWALGLGRRR
jgi:hypothetical protein